jgi:hypothetical protein
LAGVSFAADVDYFPLHVGNQWVYRATGRTAGEPRTIEVTGFESRGPRQYAVWRSFEGAVLLRTADDGTIYAFDSAANAESIYSAFTEGATFERSPDPCRQTARVQSARVRYSGPVGEFDNALEIVFTPGSCADAGITREVYLPWIGLVQRTYTTIAGPLTYDLIYARVGGVTVLSAAEVSFGISLGASTYRPGDPVIARLTLRNTTGRPLRLTFNSGQIFDLRIRNERDEVVYVWSADKLFPQVIQMIDVTAEKNWVATATPPQLPPGKYVVEAWLTTAGPRVYTASAGFEIQNP